MLGQRQKHRKGKIFYNVTESIMGDDYFIVESKYIGNNTISGYTYWTAYGHGNTFIREGNISAQHLHDALEKSYAMRLMRKL